MTVEKPTGTLCPSSLAEPGAILIGIVGDDGCVAHIATEMTVEETFLERAKVHGPPERRFRFGAPCQQQLCSHWTGSECDLIGQLHFYASSEGLLSQEKALPHCAIRNRCRWWAQRGKEACATCIYVVTDAT
jgi:hypothetical protein